MDIHGGYVNVYIYIYAQLYTYITGLTYVYYLSIVFCYNISILTHRGYRDWLKSDYPICRTSSFILRDRLYYSFLFFNKIDDEVLFFFRTWEV